jgi:XTP/dITP diphosphohydrolase
MKLLFASSNKNKITEIQEILGNQFQLQGLPDAGITEEIPETGSTITENSLLKAQYVRQRLNDDAIAIFADDSGLEVESLNGAPGVYSARYSGIPKDDRRNNEKLLNEMRQHSNRKARFVTVITLIIGNEVRVFKGEVAGTIAHEPRGTNGFGYDPLFIPTGYRSTFAEMSSETKNSISHRAEAVKKLCKFLRSFS